MTATLFVGDCNAVLKTAADNTFDSIVTDPPYEMGFMGKKWDRSGIAYSVEMWAECLRVLKPGGHLLSFGGARTHHRMTVAIEDAGFEIRDCLMWLYGSGFPKSLNLEDEWEGWGTALKPAYEPIVMARKPLQGTVAQNVTRWGTGGLNIDATRIEGVKDVPWSPRKKPNGGTAGGIYGEYAPPPTDTAGWNPNVGRWPANVLLDTEAADMLDESVGNVSYGVKPHTYSDREYEVEGYVQKVKPKAPSNYGDNGGPSRFFYIAKASRAEREKGLDDLPVLTSKETVNRDPDSKGVQNPRAGAGRGSGTPIYHCSKCGLNLGGGRAATKCPDGTEHERELEGYGPSRRNDHPTVKPVELMRWLCRLVTPPNGVILDPFVGSGSTGIAAVAEGFNFVGVDIDAHYTEIAKLRMKEWNGAEPFTVEVKC